MKKTRSESRVTSHEQKGQVIVVLMLVALVTLSIGLALTQKSVTDVTLSTQSEQSSRAFSAAEAGIEKALTGTVPSGTSFELDNEATAVVDSSVQLPIAGSGQALEYPPIGRETTAQFWFIDPRNSAVSYSSPNVDLYFGNPDPNGTTDDKPAIELKIMMQRNGFFYTKNYYFDSDQTRTTGGITPNNFTYVSGCGNQELTTGGILGPNNRFYYCKVSINNIPAVGGSGVCPSSGCKLILARARFLYSDENHKMALAPRDGANFPPQVQIYNSTGLAGQSQKLIQAFRVMDVVPPWFDFAVFSVDEIRK